MRSILALLFVAACTETPPPVVAVEPATSNKPAATTPATVPSSSLPAPAESCLMAHVCGCNIGCTKVSVAASDLHDGMKAKAKSGPLEGQTVFVLQETDTSGGPVFAVSDRGHTAACQADRSLFGYACALADSGPVPAKACENRCN